MSYRKGVLPPLPELFNRKQTPLRSCLLGLSALSVLGTAAPPAVAQAQESFQLEEIVVTARRREERLQDVPISMTVFNQDQLDNANITNAGDLATITPSLATNTRFGQDYTIFQIRGFTQELRTTSSVGVYFAEVIAPRGGNTSSSGDGAGPGDFFDLENVQVLKGPQGTLFGRNTTGGAVLLMPKRPTDEFEGYAEVSAGNYDMRRFQGVLNLPVSDNLRLRFGVDDQQREGHLNNISGVGPEDFSDVDYTAFRASAIIDVTDDLENYTIFKMVDSQNNNTVGTVIDCNPAPGTLAGEYCAEDFARREAAGIGGGFYDVWNNMEDPRSEIDSWQAINTTTWEISDNLTVKNILSYAEFEASNRGRLYGTNWLKTPLLGGAPQEFVFAIVNEQEGRLTASTETFVEELQFQGLALDDRLTWQAGIYYEKSEPKEDYGSQTFAFLDCDPDHYRDPNPQNWRCNDVALADLVPLPFTGSQANVQNLTPLFPPGTPPQVIAGTAAALSQAYLGSMTDAPGGVTYTNKAVFAQGTYDFSDELALTAGLRYTDDETEGYTTQTIALFPGNLFTGGYFPPDRILTIENNPEVSSDEFTWVLGLDYKPDANSLYYAKYARGYRQGSVNLAGTPPFDTHEPEQVDTYELGAKLSFDGAMPATLNMAVFYNDFQDQQLQLGYRNNFGVGTTAIVNAGASTILGTEIEGNILLTDNLSLAVSYAYLDTEVDDLDYPELPEDILAGSPPTPATAEGEPLPLTPENQLVTTLSYRLPIDQALGDLSAAVTYIYTDERQSASPSLTQSPWVVLDDYELINLNLNWNAVGGSAFDMSMFATNVTDEEYYTYVTGNWGTGFELGQVSQPRMYGMRLRYNF